MSLGVAARVGGSAIGAALALLVIVATSAGAKVDWSELRTLHIAHQGGENEAPSNTMYAFDRALRLGADLIELDVHTTADGEVVVLHDATVDRTTDGSGRVYDMTLDEVQALDAAYNFVPGENARGDGKPSDYPFRGVRTGARKPPPGAKRTDFRIPTLKEVLRAYPTVPTNIEIKGAADEDTASFTRNAEALAALLNRIGRDDGIIVVSFNDAALRRFRELAPQVDLAPGVAGVAAFKLANVPPGPGMVAFQVPAEFQGIPVADRDFVRRAHDGGYAVHVWTIDDEPTMLQLFEWGVDGVMTAVPSVLERVLCAHGIDRPPRPRSLPGRHCAPRASVACTVIPRGPVRFGRRGRVRVTLRRADEFAGPCAGWVSLRVRGSRGRALASFDFSERPPREGGPRRRVVGLRLRPAARRAVRRGRARGRVAARPYGAFVRRAQVRIR